MNIYLYIILIYTCLWDKHGHLRKSWRRKIKNKNYIIKVPYKDSKVYSKSYCMVSGISLYSSLSYLVENIISALNYVINCYLRPSNTFSVSSFRMLTKPSVFVTAHFVIFHDILKVYFTNSHNVFTFESLSLIPSPFLSQRW